MPFLAAVYADRTASHLAKSQTRSDRSQHRSFQNRWRQPRIFGAYAVHFTLDHSCQRNTQCRPSNLPQSLRSLARNATSTSCLGLQTGKPCGVCETKMVGLQPLTTAENPRYLFGRILITPPLVQQGSGPAPRLHLSRFTNSLRSGSPIWQLTAFLLQYFLHLHCVAFRCQRGSWKIKFVKNFLKLSNTRSNIPLQPTVKKLRLLPSVELAR